MTTQRPAGRARRTVSPRLVVALVVMVLALVFVLQNRGPVNVYLFTLTLSAPLWLLLVVMIAVGLLVGVVVTRRR
ncbi:DUF1049 domain-containing protein [Pseudonocardia lutea]|jgi:uncharacterized integral membrane protein|uniref:DUF1049 domain-containing protein n=1 Tax=Pseudonocardia lutea TaxID=2172015 RepID=A0ABW1IJ34_9PSEU